MLPNQREQRQKYIAWFLLISCVGLLIRTFGFSATSADLEQCLVVWMDELSGPGGLKTLANYTGDYNMPYVTVLWILTRIPIPRVIGIKLFSVLFDFIGAVAAGLLVEHFYPERFMLAFGLVFLSPIVIVNSSWWGQCDMVYTAFILLMLLCLIKDRPKTAFVLLGCAFSFKLQAILILPFVLIHYWKSRRYSAWHFLLVPITMIALCIPAIMGGYSPLIAFSVYKRQMGRYPFLFLTYPNIWGLFENAPYYRYQYAGIVAMLILLGVFAYYVITGKKIVSGKAWIRYAFFTVAVAMVFLPCMHERYGYLLEILAIIYAILDPEKWWVAVCYHISSAMVYYAQQFEPTFWEVVPARWMSLFYLVIFTAFFLVFASEERMEIIRYVRENGEAQPHTPKKEGRLEWAILNKLQTCLLPLIVLVTAALSIYVKRMPSDYTAPSFLPDFLEQEGNVHTAFYMFGIHLLTYIPRTPVLLMKTLIACMDVVLAYVAGCYGSGATIRIAMRPGKESFQVQMKFLLTYGLVLMLPSLFANGVLWVHVDCFCMTFFLLGLNAFQQKHDAVGTLLYALCCAIQFQYICFLPLLVILWLRKRKGERKRLLLILGGLLMLLLVLPLPALGIGYTLRDLYASYIRCFDIAGASGIGVYNFSALWPEGSMYGLWICLITYVLLLVWQFQVGKDQEMSVFLIWGYFAAVVFLPGMLIYYIVPLLVLLVIQWVKQGGFSGILGSLSLLTLLEFGEYLYDRETLFTPLFYEVILIGAFFVMMFRLMKTKEQKKE